MAATGNQIGKRHQHKYFIKGYIHMLASHHDSLRDCCACTAADINAKEASTSTQRAQITHQSSRSDMSTILQPQIVTGQDKAANPDWNRNHSDHKREIAAVAKSVSLQPGSGKVACLPDMALHDCHCHQVPSDTIVSSLHLALPRMKFT